MMAKEPFKNRCKLYRARTVLLSLLGHNKFSQVFKTKPRLQMKPKLFQLLGSLWIPIPIHSAGQASLCGTSLSVHINDHLISIHYSESNISGIFRNWDF